MKYHNLVFGLSGIILTSEEQKFFTNSRPIGFILFARNIATTDQLKKLVKSLKTLFTDYEPLIFIDQEGGRVARIKPPISKQLYPASQKFADLYNLNPAAAKASVYKNYLTLMQELQEFNIDSACAPVCDLNHHGADQIIGDRSFGSDPEQVIELCTEVISAIEKHNGIAFLKHIPGHGRANIDSHVGLPVINTPILELEKTDFKVFSALAALKPQAWAMTAHIVYTAIDSEKPATLSPKVIDYIRNNIKFTGTLVTDDLAMYALHGDIGQKKYLLGEMTKYIETRKEPTTEIRNRWKSYFNLDLTASTEEFIDIHHQHLKVIAPQFNQGLAQATTKALNAGCDIILHCSGVMQEMQAIYDAYQTSRK